MGKFQRVTLNTINAKLAAAGYAERLRRGRGYFYFTDGDASRWPTSSVNVSHLTALSLDQWFEEFLILKDSK